MVNAPSSLEAGNYELILRLASEVASATPKTATTKALATNLPLEHPFDIALSLASEDADFVRAVAKNLIGDVDRIFYYEFFETELLSADGDLKLQRIYDAATLIVPFFSKHYRIKQWSKMEWKTIRGVMVKRDDSVIPVHLDDTTIEGWPHVGFGIRLDGRSPEEIAAIILKRFQLHQAEND